MKYTIEINFNSDTKDYSIDFFGDKDEELDLEYYQKMLEYLKEIVNHFENGLNKKVEKTFN